jgi:deazaflavin-dependent oxidoreductase (nitroreductase family)
MLTLRSPLKPFLVLQARNEGRGRPSRCCYLYLVVLRAPNRLSGEFISAHGGFATGAHNVCSTRGLEGRQHAPTMGGLAMRLKRPQGNALVLAILRSPLHRLLSGLAVELRYTGRRSGRKYVLPVQYARSGNRLVLWPQGADRKSWWRNFRTPAAVTVRVAGRVYRGTARVVAPGDPEWERARSVYATRWRRLQRRLAGPFVVVGLDSPYTDNGTPTRP